MNYQTNSDLTANRTVSEYLQYDERDPCYTWLYPLDLSEFDARGIWRDIPPFPPLRRELTLYVHIPFCQFICRMCPFTHEPIKKYNLNGYVDSLIREIEVYSAFPGIGSRPVSSLYFGGGTASSLSTEQLERLLGALRRHYNIGEATEITLECHPRTVDGEYLAAARAFGIERVSFGIQSFNQANIDSLKLHQKTEQSRAILETAMATGFRTVAMDLMYRYPGQTLSDLEHELDAALAIGVHGLSVYALDAEVRGLTTVKDRQGSVMVERDMYFYLHDRLMGEGWIHVAQPDFARNGHENRQLHDLWGAPQTDSLAFGAGAFSEGFNGYTWANIHNPNHYVDCVNKGCFPIAIGQRHGWDDAVSRYPALGVRCLEFRLAPFTDAFNVEFEMLYRFELDRLFDRGWAEISDGTFRVTRAGKFFIDNISKTFYNLRNRGKPQFWGTQLQSFRPQSTYAFDEILR